MHMDTKATSTTSSDTISVTRRMCVHLQQHEARRGRGQGGCQHRAIDLLLMQDHRLLLAHGDMPWRTDLETLSDSTYSTLLWHSQWKLLEKSSAVKSVSTLKRSSSRTGTFHHTRRTHRSTSRIS